MPLTPADVANKQFKISFRGYSLDEVDGFLDEVEGELGRLLRENNDLRIGRPAGPAFSEASAPVQQAAAPVALAPGEGQEAALRTLLLAQRTADEVVAEARGEAATIVAEAQRHADGVEAEIAARISAAMGGVDQRKRELEQQIEDLRAFEREYRIRLKAYLEGQLRDLSTRGAPDDGGAGVPAAARTAAVGLGPVPGAPSAPPQGAGPAAPPAAPPAVPAPPVPPAPPAAPAAAEPAAPAAATMFAPAPPAPAPVSAPAVPPTPPGTAPGPLAAPPGAPFAGPVGEDGAPSQPPSYRPTEPPASPPPPTFSAPSFVPAPPAPVPTVAPDGPPSGPPREAESPALRAVPPLQSPGAADPIGPFTIVPPSIFSEQLDDGPEPPAEH